MEDCTKGREPEFIGRVIISGRLSRLHPRSKNSYVKLTAGRFVEMTVIEVAKRSRGEHRCWTKVNSNPDHSMSYKVCGTHGGGETLFVVTSR